MLTSADGRRQTIKDFARNYFTQVNYVDVFGRNIGFDYEHILAAIRAKFPNAKTSKRWLRMMAYELNGVVPMPARRRSRRALAEEFAMSLLVRRVRGSDTRGMRFDHIVRIVREKFPDQVLKASDLRRLESRLRGLGFYVPERVR